jgi:ketosteroid isomerase-like protein
MKENTVDLKKLAQQFFAAYDAGDVEGMTLMCTDDARGRYVPYGRESVAPIRGGIDAIWRAFPQVVKGYRVQVLELLLAEGNAVVAQTLMSGPIPPDPLGISKRGEPVAIPHVFILRYTTDGEILRPDAYWDNAVLNGLRASVL